MPCRGGVSPAGQPSIGAFGPVPELLPHERAFLVWLFESSGLQASAYRDETLRRRLSACLRAVRAADVSDARIRLEQEPSLIPSAVGALVIGVTSFFRDRGVFAHLEREVLPLLRCGVAAPRVWSAGCSSGEELYSVAMLLDEQCLLDDAMLLGTDCRAPALTLAREGRYSDKVMGDLAASRRERYFRPVAGDGWQVNSRIRSAVQWRSGDLTRLVEPGNWDLILCRNVIMYLQPAIAANVYRALERALKPGGFLVLGKAERPIGTQRLSATAPCVFRRVRVSESGPL